MDPDVLRHLPRELASAFGETGLMVGIGLGVAIGLGVPVGALLFVADTGLWGRRWIQLVAGAVINAIRSTPFVVLLVLLLPVTQVIVGSSIGPLAASVPLAVAATAFYARLVESSLRAIDHGAIEAAVASGASTRRIIAQILLPEALPGLVRGATITAISLIGFSAMAGIVGGGGVGDLAIRYGYYRYETAVMVITVLLLLALVQAVQWLGDWAARRLER